MGHGFARIGHGLDTDFLFLDRIFLFFRQDFMIYRIFSLSECDVNGTRIRTDEL
jgi:hypothetical protein